MTAVLREPASPGPDRTPGARDRLSERADPRLAATGGSPFSPKRAGQAARVVPPGDAGSARSSDWLRWYLCECGDVKCRRKLQLLHREYVVLARSAPVLHPVCRVRQARRKLARIRSAA